MYQLIDVYKQANTDEVSINVDGKGYEARLRQGIKITRERESVQIFNTTQGVFYKEITLQDYEMFLEYGWVIGVYMLALQNYKRKLEVIENKMRNEINSRKNDRYIKGLKKARKEILDKYRRTSKKLNKLLIN